MSGPTDPTVLLDIDGTLVDSNHLHAIAWAGAFRDHGHDVPTAAVHRMIGAGSEVLMGELIGEPEPAVADSWRQRFDQLSDELAPLPGAVDLVTTVREHGGRSVLATSSPPDLVDRHLDTLGLTREDLDGVTTAGDVDQAKPEPDVFAQAMELVGAEPDRTVVVGDSVWDVKAATAIGVPILALTCGGTPRMDLLAAGARAVYDTPADLVEQLERTPLGALLGVGATGDQGHSRAGSDPESSG